MKVVVKETSKQELDFPKLMKGETTGIIVLFHNFNGGMVVEKGNSDYVVGNRYNSNAYGFLNFQGTVMLSND